jgi:hypothetical protein
LTGQYLKKSMRVELLWKTRKLSKILFLRYWPANRSYIEKYKLRLCAKKWANRFLITMIVSKIDRYANFTIKKLEHQNPLEWKLEIWQPFSIFVTIEEEEVIGPAWIGPFTKEECVCNLICCKKSTWNNPIEYFSLIYTFNFSLNTKTSVGCQNSNFHFEDFDVLNL